MRPIPERNGRKTVALARPEAIVFDMGGVLSDPVDSYDAENFAKSFPEGLPEDAPLEWFLGMSQDCLDRYLRIEPPRPPFDIRPVIGEWLARRGLSADADEVEKWHRAMTRWEVRPVYPFVRDTLAELKRMGLKLGVVSNVLVPGDQHRERFRRDGILEFFDATVFSAEFGLAKPHPSMFRHVLERLGVPPSKAWYVGDKPHRDVRGAHGVGMTAVLVDSPHADRIQDAPENVPELRIRNISELPDVVRRT